MRERERETEKEFVCETKRVQAQKTDTYTPRVCLEKK